MIKKNTILSFKDFSNSYNSKWVDLNAKCFFPISTDSPLTEEYAYLIGKLMGDGHLDRKFTLRFVGKEKEDLILLGSLIVDNFGVNPDRVSIRKRVCKGTSHLLQINCSFLGRIL